MSDRNAFFRMMLACFVMGAIGSLAFITVGAITGGMWGALKGYMWSFPVNVAAGAVYSWYKRKEIEKELGE